MTIWNDLIWRAYRAGDLTRAFRDVLLTLPKFRGRGGWLFPSHAKLALWSRCCTRTAQNALKRARDLGLLTWQERRIRAGWRSFRTSNSYTLIVGEKPVEHSSGKPCRVVLRTEPSLSSLHLPDRVEAVATLARIVTHRQRLLWEKKALSSLAMLEAMPDVRM